METTSQPPAAQKHARLVLFWTLLGVLATLAVFPYLLAINPALTLATAAPLPVLMIAQAAQMAVMLLVGNWLGLRLGQAVGLDSPVARAWLYGTHMPPVSPRTLGTAVIAGALAGVAIIGLDILFQPFLAAISQPAIGRIPVWITLLASFYGGITEELLLRLFLMTLFVWLLWKAALRGRRPPTAAIFWVAIAAAAILFGVGHLPTAAALWPLTPLVVTRIVLLNALGGVVFGYLYWRWGLEHAILAHFSADIVLHVIF